MNTLYIIDALATSASQQISHDVTQAEECCNGSESFTRESRDKRSRFDRLLWHVADRSEQRSLDRSGYVGTRKATHGADMHLDCGRTQLL